MWIKLIVFVVVIGFSAIQSLIKAAQDKARQQELQGGNRNRQAQVGVPNRKVKVQNEIEAFLRDVTGAEKREQTESIQARERRDRRRQQIEAKRVAAQRQQQKKTKPRASVKSSIGSHVDQYINKHVDNYLDHDVDEYVEATIVDSVDDHLGSRAQEMPSSTRPARKTTAATSITALLRNPEGVRNAILVNEILSRPRIFRK